jgi:CheY-like chemotaxis protein
MNVPNALAPILVVDDDKVLRQLVVEILEAEGYTTRQAGNGQEALTVLDDTAVSLITLDMYMPVMDGWAFAASYHERQEPRASLLVFTAGSDPVRYAKDVGARAFLGKPFELDEFTALVHELVGLPTATPGQDNGVAWLNQTRLTQHYPDVPGVPR